VAYANRRVRVGSFGILVLALYTVSVLGCVNGAAGSPTPVERGQRFVLYSVVASQQFVNNEDDRARGLGINPFCNYRGTGIATEDEHVGPLPGDEGLYSYSLYTSTTLRKRAGSSIFVCNYNFAKNGFCDVSLQLNGGSLIGVGEFNSMATKTFTLAITGGTGMYRGVKGDIEASEDSIKPTVAQVQVLSHEVPALQLESQRLSFMIRRTAPPVAKATPSASKAPSRPRQFVVYSVTKQEQFIDNGDDEARGWTANPFGLRDRSQEFAENEDKGGPYPGDSALFTFDLYTAPDLKTKAGSAVFTCFYYFGKDAFCDATYQLRGGTLFGGNAFGFDATTFAIAITSGTSKYLGMAGDVQQSPSGKQTERLSFTIQPT
jgi:hypothetical protein